MGSCIGDLMTLHRCRSIALFFCLIGCLTGEIYCQLSDDDRFSEAPKPGNTLRENEYRSQEEGQEEISRRNVETQRETEAGNVACVTGATGYFASELVAQLL